MFFDEIGELARFDQIANLGEVARSRAFMMVTTVLAFPMVFVSVTLRRMFVVVLLFMVMAMFMFMVVVLTNSHTRMLHFFDLAISVLKWLVGCSGMNIEFDARNSGAILPLEMKVTIA